VTSAPTIVTLPVTRVVRLVTAPEMFHRIVPKVASSDPLSLVVVIVTPLTVTVPGPVGKTDQSFMDEIEMVAGKVNPPALSIPVPVYPPPVLPEVTVKARPLPSVMIEPFAGFVGTGADVVADATTGAPSGAGVPFLVTTARSVGEDAVPAEVVRLTATEPAEAFDGTVNET
jgi:hypothetical protein